MTGCDLTTRARLYANEQGLVVDALLIHKLADEVERLQRELAEVQAAWHGRCVVIDEIERLRAELGDIANYADPLVASSAYIMRRKACRALGLPTDEQSAPQSFIEAKKERDEGWPDLHGRDGEKST